MKRFLISGLLLLFLLPGEGAASEKTLYAEAVGFYKEGSFAEARDLFENLVKDHSDSKRITTYYLLYAQSLYFNREFEKSIAVGLKFLDRYPNSRYADFCQFNIAACLYRQNKTIGAARIFLELSVTASDSKIRERCISISRDMANQLLTVEDLELLKTLITRPQIFEILTLKIAEKYELTKRKKRGVSVLEEFIRDFPDSPYRKPAEALLSRLKSRPEGTLKVGVVLSRSGDNASIGEALWMGIELAVSQYNRNAEVKVELIAKDDRSSVVGAIETVKGLIDNEDLVCVVGPLESNAVAAAGIVADINQVPLISPTATASGLTDLGDHIFQTNIDFKTRFGILGEYAVEKLKLKTFAILAPDDDYGKTAVNSFAAAVRKKGGRLIAVEKYVYGTQNFKAQFENIRKLGFIQEKTKTTEELYKLDAKEIDALYEKVVKEDNFEDVDQPLKSIDGIFIPLYGDEIKYLGPQLAFYNLETRVLGGDNWYDEQELKLVANYVNGLVFVSEYFVDRSDKSFKGFAKALSGKMAEPEIPKEAVYGYDTMNFLIEGLKAGHTSARKLQDWLSASLPFQGLHNKISIGGDHVNQSVHILRFSDQGIERLDQ